MSESEEDDCEANPFVVSAWCDDWDMADPPLSLWWQCADANSVALALADGHAKMVAAGYKEVQ